jgi:Predicted acetyltransferase
MEVTVLHDTSKKVEKILCDEAEAGYLIYEISSKTLDIQHTVIYPAFRGQGLGRILVDNIIEYAKKEGLTIISSCSYANLVLGEK